MIVAFSYARVSSAEQRKGRGLRRQLQDSAACAERNGWTLDTSLTFRESKSAFRSTNLKTGALGNFLAAIREKRVKPGAVLIIESLDRLSRDNSRRRIGPRRNERAWGRDKQYHDWGQSESEAAYLIDVLTEPGNLVVDPFCGGGAIPAACKATGRRWLATEKDKATVLIARKRMAEMSSH